MFGYSENENLETDFKRHRVENFAFNRDLQIGLRVRY